MQLSLADDIFFALSSGLIILVYGLGRSVAARDPTVSRSMATFWIFSSSLWFIGPVLFFVFRKRHPLLAKRCLQQLLIANIAFLLIAAAYTYLGSVSGAIISPAPTAYSSSQ